jgi:hypothetical protein
MKRRMNKTKFLSLRGARLIGLVLLIAGLAALLVLSPDIVLGQGKGKGGKPDKPSGKGEPGLYRVSMSILGEWGLDTVNYPACNREGYVLAEWDDAHNYLHANGTMINPDPNVQIRIPLLMQLLTDVPWGREYVADPVKGLSGIFYGCYGETGYYNGALFITFKKKRKKTYISFTWHFDYHTAADVREHFSLFSNDIPFPPWTGEDIIFERVNGRFDLHYYLNDPDSYIGYESITDGLGRDFDFYITIEKIPQ